MESLYRKYRPLTFESVVGQQHIVSTLENAVTEGRLSHAYLFCGPRGTGKTTMARILAKALLCQKAAGAERGYGCMPDGSCPECEAIAAGTHPDVYELDAASRTGVDNVREEIVNSVSFAPVRGKYKVYIIDEVHMLTTAAFNALLKTLEEPPAHVVFVLCTTDPQKILETILSRCQRFDFHRISNEDIVGRMRYICEQEGFAFDEAALEIVAKHARGGMRDALSTLEQLSVFGDGAVRETDARSLLGETSNTVLGEFSRGIASRDAAGLFGLIRSQVDEGNDLMELTRDLVAHLRDVYTVRVAGAKPELVDATPEEVSALGEEAALFEGADRLGRCLTVLDDAALGMRDAADARLVLEIACTRLARPESDLTLEALAERLDRIEAQLAAGVPSAPMGAAVASAASAVRAEVEGARAVAAPVPRPAAPAVTARAAAPQATPAPQQAPTAAGSGLPWETGPHAGAGRAPQQAPASAAAVSERRAAPQPPVAPAPATPARPAARTAAQTAASAAPATPAVEDAGELQRKWRDVVNRVTAANGPRAGLLLHARATADDGSRLTVSLPPRSDFAVKMLMRPDTTEVILPIVCAVFGSRTVEYEMEGAAAGPDPAVPVATAAPQPAPAARSVEAPSHGQTAPAPTAPSAAPSATAPDTSGAPAPAPSPAAAVVSAPAPSPAAPTAPVPAPQASAPAAGTAAPASAAPPAAPDQVSGPTVVPEPDVEADRRAWEAEQVPYDDATIAAYEEERPPAAAPAASSVPTATVSSAPATSQAPSPSSALPWDSAAAAPAEEIPQSEEEAKAMLGGIFGAGIVFKPVE